MTEPKQHREEADAQCPRCGLMTLRLVAGTMLCDDAACGYEHLLTLPISIVPPRRNPNGV